MATEEVFRYGGLRRGRRGRDWGHTGRRGGSEGGRLRATGHVAVALRRSEVTTGVWSEARRKQGFHAG